MHTLEVATYPRRVARTGVLQGEAANANVRPARYACTPDNQIRSGKIKILQNYDKKKHNGIYTVLDRNYKIMSRSITGRQVSCSSSRVKIAEK